MKREIIKTQDGSTTIHLIEWEESYHSKHGAIQEAYHVFIKSGFDLFEEKPLSILEIGFGTGFLSMLALKHGARSIVAYESDINRYQLGCEVIKILKFIENFQM